MAKHQESASRIWRTVVFAGAMLGAPLVAQAEDKPTPPPAEQKPSEKPADKDKPADKTADKDKPADTSKKKPPPKKKRPRGTDDGGGGGTGRGFVLS